MDKVRVRFAPSPTGPLHIGGARSALFNYLLSRKTGGDFVLRIEDTDLERSSRESENNIFASLKWLNMDWDEGPDKGGTKGPYRQTERLEIYNEMIQKLLNEGMAYYCFCSEEEIESERQAALVKGETPKYGGHCRSLTREEVEEKIKQGEKPVVRFRVPENDVVVIDDMVRGRITFETNGIGDFVIVKSDGIPTYNFAVVIDDYLMNITHVVRAEEHLSNTPRQIVIYQALNWKLPKFAHISLILGKDRTKMSKRHGATSVVQYQEQGYLPEAVVNFLALLGWSPGGEEEIFSLEELINQFSLTRVAKNPAVFDMEKLKWINGFYIRKSSVERITDLAIPFLQKAGFLNQTITDEEYEWAKLIVIAVQEKMHCISEIIDYMDVFAGEEVVFENEEAKAVMLEEQVQLVINSFRAKIAEMNILKPEEVKKAIKAITKETKLGGRKVFMPLRVALTGKMHGPELHFIIPVLGKELIEKRLTKTVGI